jgi:hypothetical protein
MVEREVVQRDRTIVRGDASRTLVVWSTHAEPLAIVELMRQGDQGSVLTRAWQHSDGRVRAERSGWRRGADGRREPVAAHLTAPDPALELTLRDAADLVAHPDLDEGRLRVDVGMLDRRGLYAPPGALRSLAYELCIARALGAHVRALSAQLRLAESPGRSSCRADEWLVLGETAANHLAYLPGASPVVRADFE